MEVLLGLNIVVRRPDQLIIRKYSVGGKMASKSVSFPHEKITETRKMWLESKQLKPARLLVKTIVRITPKECTRQLRKASKRYCPARSKGKISLRLNTTAETELFWFSPKKHCIGRELIFDWFPIDGKVMNRATRQPFYRILKGFSGNRSSFLFQDFSPKLPSAYMTIIAQSERCYDEFKTRCLNCIILCKHVFTRRLKTPLFINLVYKYRQFGLSK